MKETTFPIMRALCYTGGYWLLVTILLCNGLYWDVNVFEEPELKNIRIFGSTSLILFIGFLAILVYPDENKRAFKLSLNMVRLISIGILLFALSNDSLQEFKFWMLSVGITFIATAFGEMYLWSHKKDIEDATHQSNVKGIE